MLLLFPVLSVLVLVVNGFEPIPNVHTYGTQKGNVCNPSSAYSSPKCGLLDAVTRWFHANPDEKEEVEDTYGPIEEW